MKQEPGIQSPLRHLRSALPWTILLAASFLTGCAQTKPPEKAEIQKTVTATAKVLSVDQNTRILALQSEKGETVRVRVGPEVRNLPQIAAGDTVRVQYHASLAVELKKPDQASPALAVGAAASRAAPGETPGAAAGAQVTVTVRIESVDLERHVVVFEPPGGGLEAVEVARPEGREFIRGLKSGDRVQITYTEAVALGVEKQ